MFRKLTLLSGILALLVIILGAYVRLSNAGLGCPDWPGCYGQALIQDTAQFKADAEAAFPEQPLDTAKAWKELSHRYLAGGLALVLLSLPFFAWRLSSWRGTALAWSVAALVLLVIQALFGMWTVNLKVMPIVVTGHMLLGFTTFWAIAWLYIRTHEQAVLRPQPFKLRWFARFAMLILGLQILLGGWVSSNFAALACTDFPRCQGEWWPAADYQEALDVFYGLSTGNSNVLSNSGQIAAHVLHRLGALISFVVLMLLMFCATGEAYPKPLRRAGVVLSLLLFVQIGLGVYSVKQGFPLGLGIAHNLFALLLMLPLLAIYFFSKYALADAQTTLANQLSDTAYDASALEAELPIRQERTATSFDALSADLARPVSDAARPSLHESEPESLFVRLKTQLKKTRGSLGQVLSSLTLGQNKVTQQLLEELEASLLMADIGIETTTAIIARLKESLDHDQLKDGEALSLALKQQLYEMLAPCSLPLKIPQQAGPFVILVVGVNGVGKTTTIGKLANRLQAQGHSVMLAAGDTFRAAAVEQLQTWGERNNIQVVAQHSGADSASVIFDALQSAQSKGVDVLIADTAGRLHTKSNLMEELKKIKRIMAKLDAQAPHEVMLILDAGTGQNALSQARLFNEAVNLTGLVLTKLDGTAKGGVIFALANQLHIPIRYIGVGESIADLQDFDAQSFIDALFVKD